MALLIKDMCFYFQVEVSFGEHEQAQRSMQSLFPSLSHLFCVAKTASSEDVLTSVASENFVHKSGTKTFFFFICGRTHLHTHISATTALIHATFTMREMPLQANFPGMQSTMLQSNRGTNKWLLVIFSGKHALSSPKDGVFVWVVGLVLGWYFQNSWYRGSVAVDQMSDHLCYVLVDEDDVNVSTLNESFEAVFYFRHTRVFIHYFEVRLPLLVDLSDASKQKSNARILIAYNGNELSSGAHN